MYNLHVEREIAVSHQLKYHDGKCRHLHGHNLKVIVDIEATNLIKEGSSMNMVVDFGTVKKEIDRLDHTHLNDYFEGTEIGEQPTSEILCKFLADRIADVAENDYITKIQVAIYEATGQYAQYTR
jgi:6-pyruvoyltetrahydropterin/6-carboxytetrahydropterin synthase